VIGGISLTGAAWGGRAADGDPHCGPLAVLGRRLGKRREMENVAGRIRRATFSILTRVRFTR